MVRHQPKEWRRLGAPGCVDATHRRRRVGRRDDLRVAKTVDVDGLGFLASDQAAFIARQRITSYAPTRSMERPLPVFPMVRAAKRTPGGWSQLFPGGSPGRTIPATDDRPERPVVRARSGRGAPPRAGRAPRGVRTARGRDEARRGRTAAWGCGAPARGGCAGASARADEGRADGAVVRTDRVRVGGKADPPPETPAARAALASENWCSGRAPPRHQQPRVPTATRPFRKPSWTRPSQTDRCSPPVHPAPCLAAGSSRQGRSHARRRTVTTTSICKLLAVAVYPPLMSAERQLLLRADRTMLHAARMVGPLGNSKHR